MFRVCLKPPTKMVLMKKLERYLSDLNIKSGIDYERGNFPDKKWLILVIATLSKG